MQINAPLQPLNAIARRNAAAECAQQDAALGHHQAQAPHLAVVSVAPAGETSTTEPVAERTHACFKSGNFTLAFLQLPSSAEDAGNGPFAVLLPAELLPPGRP